MACIRALPRVNKCHCWTQCRPPQNACSLGRELAFGEPIWAHLCQQRQRRHAAPYVRCAGALCMPDPLPAVAAPRLQPCTHRPSAPAPQETPNCIAFEWDTANGGSCYLKDKGRGVTPRALDGAQAGVLILPGAPVSRETIRGNLEATTPSAARINGSASLGVSAVASGAPSKQGEPV